VPKVCAQNWTKVAKGSFVKIFHNKRSLMTWNCKGPMEELILGLEIHDRNAARDEISLPHKFFFCDFIGYHSYTNRLFTKYFFFGVYVMIHITSCFFGSATFTSTSSPLIGCFRWFSNISALFGLLKVIVTNPNPLFFTMNVSLTNPNAEK